MGTTASTDADNQSGDEQAALLDQLVTQIGPAIYRTALSVLHDRAAAEEVVQETIVKAWRNLDSLRDPGALKPWVLRIAHNVAVSHVRKRRSVPMETSSLPEAADRSADLSQDLENKSAVTEVWQALHTLDPMSRSIVVLRELEGMSYDEIADVVGVPLATVKTRLFRARRELAEQLKAWR